MKTILFIDGRNFISKINSVVNPDNNKEVNFSIYNFAGLWELKNHLEGQGFEVVYAGRVRGHEEVCPRGHKFLTFKEKGVDVRLAVDMITFAHNKELKTAIIGSSDSDLQPAIEVVEFLGKTPI